VATTPIPGRRPSKVGNDVAIWVIESSASTGGAMGLSLEARFSG